MILWLAIGFVLFIGVIVIFAFPQFSPIPYFPSNAHDMDLIVQALKLKNSMTVLDLGAGDGIVIFRAADQALTRKLDTEFVAVEINPILVAILHIRRLMHPNRRRIRIIWGDLFRMDYAPLVKQGRKALVYIYVTPRLIPSILESVRKTIPQFRTVSYYYSLAKNMKPAYTGVHDIYVSED